MKRLLTFMVFILYKFHENLKNSKDIEYESAIFTALILIWLNIIFILIIFDAHEILKVFDGSNATMFVKFGLYYIIPGYIILKLLVKKKDIMEFKISDSAFEKGKVFMFIYLILTIIAFLIGIFLRTKQIQ
ncbi:MAG: hypothetical protein HZB59_04110 [Ignavibacteriales bacterium]|nr:hypothetical protein [Ignavibacteriales bacterium]